ncbi:MAG: hypothetical protein WD851_08065 [Pirellulales bacterium]
MTDGQASVDSRAVIRSDGAGNVIALVGGLASQDTGLDYIPDVWQHWELEYAVGGSTFSVRVNGVSAGPFASPTAGQVNTGEIFNGAWDPAGSVFVDAGDSVNIIGNTTATSIDLGSLMSVGGSVNINGNTAATSINMNSLNTVGGELTITDNTSATVIGMNSLNTVGGDVDISGNTSAMAIDMGALTTVSGDLDISGNTATEVIDMGALTSASGDVDISGNTSAIAIDMSALTTVSGDLDINGNTSATAIDMSALTIVSVDLGINGNTSAGFINMGALTTASGDVDISGNGPGTVVNMAANVTVGGDLTIETTGSGTFDVAGADVEGDTSLTAGGYTQVAAATAGGETAVTMLNSEATMELVLRTGTFPLDDPVTFSIERLPGSVETIGGDTITHLETYSFDFAIPTLNSAAELNFEINLLKMDEPDRLSLLGLLHDGALLTLGVLGDAPGSELQLFDVCASGTGPVADACVVVEWLDENRLLLDPLGGTDPSILRLEGLVGHFSTYSFVAVARIPEPATISLLLFGAVFCRLSLTRSGGNVGSGARRAKPDLRAVDRMTVLSRVGADGVLNVSVPLGLNDANRSVQVIIEPAAKETNGVTDYETWLDGLAGRWQGDFMRGDEGSFETRGAKG